MLKAIKNKVNVIQGLSPFPLSTEPVLTIVGFNISDPMVAYRAPNQGTSISHDRRTITLDSGVIGLKLNEELKAFIVTSNGGTYPVEIAGVIDDTLILTEPLSREVVISDTEPCDIHFNSYFYSLTPTTQGMFTYSILYTGLDGDNHVEKGIIKVVNRPFDTGLSHLKLLNIFPSLSSLLQRNQEAFSNQIKSGLDILSLKVRSILSGSIQKLDEDSILNPESLMTAHAYFAGAVIYEGLGEWETASQYREQGDAMLNLAMSSISLDYNGDGEVTNEETLIKKKGGNAGDLGGNFNRSSIDWGFNPKRSQKH